MVLFGSASLPGARYGKLNQDHIVVGALFSPPQLRAFKVPQIYILLVLDGHGMLGELAAQRAGAAIMAGLKRAFGKQALELGCLDRSKIEQIFVDAFRSGHDAALDCYVHPPAYYQYPRGAAKEKRYSLARFDGKTMYVNPLTRPQLVEFGTTATAVVMQGDTMAVAHVGDSMVALGRSMQMETSSSSRFEATWLTESHSGNNAKERERLEKQHDDSQERRISFQGEDGYALFNVPNGGFSLAMTRALGHRILSASGVSPVPEVTVRKILKEDVCIIAGTDGLWDGIEPDEAINNACDAYMHGLDADEIARELCAEAVRNVAKEEPGSRPDNTSAALLIFSSALDECSEDTDASI